MDNAAIWKNVLKIRRQSATKSQDEQIKENKEFFDMYPAIFLMARDTSMNIDTFKHLLDLKNQVDVGSVDKEKMDVYLGQMFYEKYVNIKE
jgi:hypothetical protein